MLNYFPLPHCICLILLTLGSAAAVAQAPADPAAGVSPVAGVQIQPPAQLPQDPYTVTDVLVDKTAKNAVIAREEAIVEAQRIAFQKLAERNMTPEEFRKFALPDDKTIGSIVQDFEIKNEQLSFTRYAANFTVRFRDGVRNYINIALPEYAVAEGTAGLMEEPSSRFVLVLPYLENMAGRMVLWEDPNPWRRIWQNGLPKLEEGGRQFFVPLGDISDISAGSSDAVWSGDYSVVEKLRASYNADEVVLAVANKSGTVLTVDLYSWKDGKFERKDTLTPAAGELLSEEDAYKIGAMDVMKSLQRKVLVPRPLETVAAISRELTGRAPVAATSGEIAEVQAIEAMEGAEPPENAAGGPVPAVEAPVPSARMPASAGPLMEVDATMSFTDFASWMELQKRLSSVVPPVKVDIRSISKEGASFTMKFQGTVDILKKMLAENGVALSQPAVEVDPSVLGEAPRRPTYDLRLTDIP